MTVLRIFVLVGAVIVGENNPPFVGVSRRRV